MAAHTADELQEDVLADCGSAKMWGGVLVFVATTQHPEGVARVIHNVRKHTGVGTHRKSVFGYVGDVVETDIEVTQFSKLILEVTDPMSVHKDIDAHLAALAAIPPTDTKMLGPFDHTADATLYEEVETRKSMFLPVSLMQYVLPDENLPAGKATEILLAAIRAQGIENQCQDLILFLKYASTYRKPVLLNQQPPPRHGPSAGGERLCARKGGVPRAPTRGTLRPAAKSGLGYERPGSYVPGNCPFGSDPRFPRAGRP